MPPLDTAATLPPPAVLATPSRRPRPSAVCIDCDAAPPISDDALPLLLPLPCLHFICHPCWHDLIATIDEEPEHPSLDTPFCHHCHPPPLPTPSSPAPRPRPRAPPTPPTGDRAATFLSRPCPSPPSSSPPPSLPPSGPPSPASPDLPTPAPASPSPSEAASDDSELAEPIDHQPHPAFLDHLAPTGGDDEPEPPPPPATPAAAAAAAVASPPATPATPIAPRFVLADPRPVAPDGTPFLCYIGTCRAAFSAPGPFANHLRSDHQPCCRIPDAIFRAYGLHPCPACSKPYTSATILRTRHKCPNAAASPAAPAAAATAAPAAAPAPPLHTTYYAANAAFFATFPPDSINLDHVHGQAIDSLPAASLPLVDAVLSSFLAAALRLPDDDAPTTAIYALPRLVLAPPPEHHARRQLPDILRDRVASLARGEADALWSAHDWLQSLPAATDFPATSTARSSARITAAATHRSPSTIYRKLTAPPYLPPTPHAESILLSLFPRHPNPDLDASDPDALPAAAAAHLPSAPLPSGFIWDGAERAELIAEWTRYLHRHPTGQPDGTGFRGSLFTACTASLPLTCQWLQQIYLFRTTPAHRRRLASKTLNGQVKPDKQTKRLPTTASGATAARPLARHPVTRRLAAGMLSRRLTRHFRARYLALHQYGLVPAGIEAAPRRHQLHHDLRPPDLAHAALDVVNAHTSIARLPIFRYAYQLYAASRHHLDHLAALYTLAYYSFPGATFIQVHHTFNIYHQTDATDQGEALAQHSFGITFALVLAIHLLPRCPTLLLSLIHDDTTLADRPFVPATAGDAPPPQVDPAITPLPYAITLFADVIRKHLRLSIATHKTLLFQPPLPPADPRSLPRLLHLFPPNSRHTCHAFVLAGCPVGTAGGIATVLADHLTAFDTATARLLQMPGLSLQLRTLILNLCCRPSSSFAHLLRHLPPTATADPQHPLLPLAFPPAYADPVSLCFAHHLRRLALDALAQCLRLPRTAFSAADPASGTAVQLLLRASDGGVNFPDPALLASPSFLGSFAGSLPALSLDPFLAPFLADPAAWPLSPSPVLRAAHAAFGLLAPLLAASATAADASCYHQSLRAHLTAPDGSLSILLLPSAAGRRPQHSFSHGLFTHITRHLVSSASPLSPLARARLRHAAVPPAPMLFQMYFIPTTSALTATATQFLYCHRLGVPLPFLPSPLPPHCHPKCPTYSARRNGFPGALYHTLAHAYHQCACGATPRRTRRHDTLAMIIGKAATTHLHALIDLRKRLASSVTSGTKVDLVITRYSIYPPVTAIDVTVSCPLVPTYAPAAANDTAALFTARSADKYNKHLAGCIAQERTFLPVVFSTLGGLGPPESAHYLDSLFSEVYAAELAATGTTRRTSHLRTLFLQSLLASLTAATADMASSLTRDASLDADDDDDVDPAAGAVPTPPGVPAPPVPPAPR